MSWFLHEYDLREVTFRNNSKNIQIYVFGWSDYYWKNTNRNKQDSIKLAKYLKIRAKQIYKTKTITSIRKITLI